MAERTHTPHSFSDLNQAAEFLLKTLGKTLRIATPLGLGKPNQFVNLIYGKAKKDPSYHLKIFTALSLALPHPRRSLEKAFLGPFLKRHYGDDYPELAYVQDQKTQKIPDHIQIHEFYMQAAQNLQVETAQKNYTSLNYTHVAQSLLQEDLQAIVQLIAVRTDSQGNKSYSLSCNPDLTLDLVDLYHQQGKKLCVVGVIHPELPFMGGDAVVPSDFFEILVESPEVNHQLFSLPRTPINETDHMIGLYASQLIRDDGTLQIGIGSLSDALVVSTLFRHQKNSEYQKAISRLLPPRGRVQLNHDTFQKGLYGTSEMVMDAFMHLRRAGILKREIFDIDEEKKRFLHGAFFLGSKEFYHWLRTLPPSDADGIGMTRVSKVNDLYDPHELALRRQRKNARFVNTCMNVTLLGGAASETLESGQVVSGVGGQYNFVAMSHELPDSHSVLLLKSTRMNKGKRHSNIVWSHGHLTIPRHLRDIVVTEYGIASLKGRTDEEVIKALIEIADSEFQDELVRTAQQNGKLAKDYVIPQEARQNTPQKIQDIFNSLPKKFFHAFPFGSDFTAEEERVALALSFLQQKLNEPFALVKLFWRGVRAQRTNYHKELERMQLERAKGLREWLYQRLLLGALTALKPEL